MFLPTTRIKGIMQKGGKSEGTNKPWVELPLAFLKLLED